MNVIYPNPGSYQRVSGYAAIGTKQTYYCVGVSTQLKALGTEAKRGTGCETDIQLFSTVGFMKFCNVSCEHLVTLIMFVVIF